MRDDSHHRKKLQRYEIPGDLRFLTFSCFSRLGLLDDDAVKQEFVADIRRTRSMFHYKLSAWVIMPEHVHLLLQPKLPEFPVTDLLKELKGQFSGRALRRWRKEGSPILNALTDSRGKRRFWLPGGGYDRNINSSEELEEKINYIHNNPVKRGLVQRACDWLWSSARWYAGLRDEGVLQIDPLNPFLIVQ